MSDDTHMQSRILVVDDQSTTRSLLRQILISGGFDVIEADCGEQALQVAKQNQVDGILLDLKMPGMGGIETCRQLRQLDRHLVTPILIVTAMEECEVLSEAFEAGCDDFIHKPINPVVLKSRLKGHLQRTHYYYQLEQVRHNLNRYVSPRTQKMVERYTQTGTLPPPDRLDVCVLFTDIRGFTQLSEEIEPERLFSALSRHLAYQVDLVYEYDGYIDKYAGDGVMAIFEGEDMATRACQCALDIVSFAHQTNLDQLDRDFAVGCGIHIGPAVIGNIGSPEHLDYSVIGQAVNVGARLCGFAEPMNIIVSDSVYQASHKHPRLAFGSKRDIDLKGVKKTITVYELLSAQCLDSVEEA